MNINEDLIGKVFFNKYTVVNKLGQGAFGSIYEVHYNQQKFAMKFENKLNGKNLLEKEAYIMNYLKGRKNNINKFINICSWNTFYNIFWLF